MDQRALVLGHEIRMFLMSSAKQSDAETVMAILSGLALAIHELPDYGYSLNREICMCWSVLMKHYSVIDREIVRGFAIYVAVCLLLRRQIEMERANQSNTSTSSQPKMSSLRILSKYDISSCDLPKAQSISSKELFEKIAPDEQEMIFKVLRLKNFDEIVAPISSDITYGKLRRNGAAKNIQRGYRDFRKEQSNAARPFDRQLILDINLRSRIHQHMETVQSLIDISPSAAFLDVEHHFPKEKWCNPVKNIEVQKIIDETDRVKKKFLSSRSSCEGIGSCGEIAIILWILMTEDPALQALHEAQGIYLADLNQPYDHLFVAIGKPHEPGCYIADAWLQYAPLQPDYDPETKKGYRTQWAAGAYRHGFLGSKEQFEALLYSLEPDTSFVKKSPHRANLYNGVSPKKIAVHKDWLKRIGKIA